MKAHEYQRNFELENSYWWFVGVRRMVHMLLRNATDKENLGKVLDVGCGTGSLLDELAPHAEELWGLDFSEKALAFCQTRGHERLLLGDASRLPCKDNYFDVVSAVGVIEHLQDDDAFIKEVQRVLKPGGVFIMLTSSFPFLWSMHDVANEHQRRYYLHSLEAQLHEGGFRTIRFSHLNFILFPALAAALFLHRLIYGLAAEKPERIMPVPPTPINKFLTLILTLEARVMQRIRLPWGVSMIGSFQKCTQESVPA